MGITQKNRISLPQKMTNHHLPVNPDRVAPSHILDEIVPILTGNDRVLARHPGVIQHQVHGLITPDKDRALDALKLVRLFAVLPDLESQHKKNRYRNETWLKPEGRTFRAVQAPPLTRYHTGTLRIFDPGEHPRDGSPGTGECQ